MSVYLSRPGKHTKALHDPLAACCAIDLSIGEWKDVQLYMDEKTKKWGSIISDNPNVRIIIDDDQKKISFISYYRELKLSALWVNV
jgi:pyrimidine-specific ribonucleoside hydrolase